MEKESADIFQLMQVLQLCTRSASIISSEEKVMVTTAIRFIFRTRFTGIYARAFLEGRISKEKIKIQREFAKGGGLLSFLFLIRG